ncbi:MAG: DNA/RNA non-specific endonuclease, partial [Deltaproteobacteria bacterium]|nr:DNA/RNA non-specific endonuclease [Deltaproteobacteria bacterium]
PEQEELIRRKAAAGCNFILGAQGAAKSTRRDTGGWRYKPDARRETFLMSNISPQAPDLNRSWWRVLEEMEATDFAVRLERVWVVTGPVFSGEVKKLKGVVDVPTAFYRIILDEENGQLRALAFIAPQTVTGNEPLSQRPVEVRRVKAIDQHTGRLKPEGED